MSKGPFYPARLLPFPGLAPCIDIDSLHLDEGDDFTLVRRIGVRVEDLQQVAGTVQAVTGRDSYNRTDNAIFEEIKLLTEQMHGLSLNLESRYSRAEDVRFYFKVSKSRSDTWQGQKVKRADLRQNGGPRYQQGGLVARIRASALHGMTIPYTFKGNAKDLKKHIGITGKDKIVAEERLQQILERVSRVFADLPENGFKLRGLLKLKHAPLNHNYWHVKAVLSREFGLNEASGRNKSDSELREYGARELLIKNLTTLDQSHCAHLSPRFYLPGRDIKTCLWQLGNELLCLGLRAQAER
ncbi:MAG: hypothetical protein IJ228_00480 [Succinivibrio sp.]|nr:hypothetical protein [Succinivibrio sp.]